MKLSRGSGILLHPTSLPGPFGIGDLGPSAYRFADFLSAANQKYWQILPLGPVGHGNSPYNCLSAFAGNPLLISPERLVQRGYLSEKDIADARCDWFSKVDFPRVHTLKNSLLLKAHGNFKPSEEYQTFEDRNADWLEPFARFMAWKVASHGASWTQMGPISDLDADAIRFHKFVQYEFHREWFDLKHYCNERGISIIGDLPFYVDRESSDVWDHRDIFNLDANGHPTVMGGVPPDYFSAEGQLWGNPTYRWDRLRETNYRWWVDRLKAALTLLDIVRLDHFRGFEATWEVQSGAVNAVNGTWVKGPGSELFQAAAREIGELRLVAENLGIITPQVEEIRRQFSFPGMAVLQFAFGSDATHRPHTYSRDTLACTGTHDNDTILGWWKSLGEGREPDHAAGRQAELDRASEYIGVNGHEIHWAFIRAVMTSVADLAIFPFQDILGLGTEARMNVPGTPEGNWLWRFEEECITPALAKRLRFLTELSSR